METTDKEIQTLEQLYALRKQAVRLHNKGTPVMQIVTATGLSWPGVRAALDLFERGGMATLKPAVRGKKPGTGRSRRWPALSVQLEKADSTFLHEVKKAKQP